MRAGRQVRDQDRPDRLRRPRHRRPCSTPSAPPPKSSTRHTATTPKTSPKERRSPTRTSKVIALADLFDNRMDDCHAQSRKDRLRRSQGTAASSASTPTRNCSRSPRSTTSSSPRRPTSARSHLKAAIEAGKNVFMEKPAAVDVPGVKMVMEAGELAKKKSLGIAAGTQRRHRPTTRNDQADPRRRDRRHHLRQSLLERRRDLGHRPRAGLERHGVADPQLELLHLALAAITSSSSTSTTSTS